MSYDAAAVRRLGVNPRNLKWFNSDYSEYAPYLQSSPTKPIKRRKVSRVLVPIVVLTLYFGLWIALVMISNSPAVVGVIMAMTFLLPPSLYFFSSSTLAKVISVIITLILGHFALRFSLSEHTASIVVGWMGAIAVSGITHAFMCDRSDSHTYSIEYFEQSGPRVFGVPGGVANAVDRFGKEAVDAGVKGEEYTAVLLELLLRIPGTTIYHGLHFPGSKNADVDHAVACGNTVFLIDSKLYRWGEYEWRAGFQGDEIARSDGYGRPRKNHMGDAADGYRMILGEGINVVPLVLVHGRNIKIRGEKRSSRGVIMATPHEAMQIIGDTIYMRLKTWSQNSLVEEKLVQNLKID